MSCEEFDQLRQRAHDRCEICAVPANETPRGLFIDHDLDKGKWAVRGLLCNACNTSLGKPRYNGHAGAVAYLANPFRTVPPPAKAVLGAPVQGPRLMGVNKPGSDDRSTIPLDEREDLFRLCRRYQRAAESFESARDDLYAAVLAAARPGVSQQDISRSTGLIRQTIRNLLLEVRRQKACEAA